MVYNAGVMFRNTKRVGVLSAVLAFVFIPVVMLVMQPANVEALFGSGDKDIVDKFCIPKSTKSSGYYRPDGWLEVKVINRAKMQVIYKPSGNCTKPASLNAEYFSGQKKFAELIGEGYVLDKDSGDENIDYRMFTGDDSEDDTRIDQFNGSVGQDNAEGGNGRDGILSEAAIKSLFSTSEIVLSFDEGTANIGDNCDGTNANYVLADRGTLEWGCQKDSFAQDDIGYYKGLRISSTYTNIKDFNITYNVIGSGTATKIEHVSQEERDKRTFTWCPGNNGGEFRTENCNGDLSIKSTLEAMAGLGAGQDNFTIFVDSNSKKFNVLVAGPNSVSAQTPNSSTEIATGRGLAGDESVGCESTGATLSYIFCPLIEGLADASDKIFDSFIKPLLQTNPIDLNNPNDPTFSIWKSFRLIGNIILIIALLVIVFSQSIGGGLVDAYAAKKIMPRLLVAAILINLSIYLVSIALDITNILGEGLRKLILSPLYASGNGNISLSGTFSGLGLTALASSIFVAYKLGKDIVKVFQFLLLFVFLPGFLAVLAALFTLIFRQGIIIFLVIISPIAFALYCLPNTEQYFKKWWDALLKTLLVYPIVVVVLAISNVLAATLGAAGDNQDVLTTILFDIVQVVCLILPLFLIPFAFKLAGGIIGTIGATLTGYGKRSTEAVKGNANLPNSLRNRTKGNVTGAFTRAGAQQFRDLNKYSKNTEKGRFRRGAATRAAQFFAGSIEKEALANAASKQRIFNVKDNGDDSIVNARASFVDTDGKRKTLDGKPVSETEWLAAQKQYPTLSDAQAVADYRSTKILTTEEADQFTRNFGMMAQQHGLSEEETTGMFTGLAFARQNERGEYKHGRYIKGEDGQFRFQAAGDPRSLEDGRSGTFLKEQYHKRGSYDGARMFSSYFQSMGDIKAGHLNRLEELNTIRAGGGPLSAAQEQQRQNSLDELKQIKEMENSFEYKGMIRDPETGEMKESGGLTGASAATIAAFEKMKALDNTAGPGAKASLDQINSELSYGQTWESDHSPDHGDFSNRNR